MPQIFVTYTNTEQYAILHASHLTQKVPQFSEAPNFM